RKIALRPDEPAAHALIFGELLIGTLYRLVRISVAQDEHAAWLGIAAAREANNHCVLYFGLVAQRFFEVRRIDVHARRRDDHILSAALEVEIPFLVDGPQVSGAKPAFVSRYWNQLFALPVRLGDVLTAHQDLTALIELHLATGQ